MTSKLDALRERMATDFPFYAEHNLVINTKDGKKAPFVLNKAQRYIHERIEAQRAKLGYVRVIVVKARQQGCSTYTAGRYYWKVTTREAVNAFILSHAQDTTKKLFAITTRYHANCDDMFKPRTKALSTVEIQFDRLDSSYYVGTAGAKEVGRGSTIHYFHGSEVAFWANASEHFMGIMQAVPTGEMAKDTEVILESTANGESGKFYELVQSAMKGEGEYEVIFTPWFWQDEYSKPAPDDYEVAEIDKKIQAQYDLSRDQMYWREHKIKELGGEWRFKQEFPSNVEEAFQTSGTDSFIPPSLVMKCVTEKGDLISEDGFAKIGSCDPGGKTADSDPTCIGHRVNTRIKDILRLQALDTTEIVDECVKYIQKHDLDWLMIDTIGIGAGVYDQMKRYTGYGHMVLPCNFTGATIDKKPDGQPLYYNHRAECWGRAKIAMENNIYEVPNDDDVRGDLTAPGFEYSATRGSLLLESKKDMRSRGVKSPNIGDMIAMTYSRKLKPRLNTVQNSVNIITDYDPLGRG